MYFYTYTMGMKKSKFTLAETHLIKRLQSAITENEPIRSAGSWVRFLRTNLRMNQKDLARRARMDQGHLAKIEAGKWEPTLETIKKIFGAMGCRLAIEPRLEKPFEGLLREQARRVAVDQLNQSMGSMALEKQAPADETYNAMVEKKTDEILEDQRFNLWQDLHD